VSGIILQVVLAGLEARNLPPCGIGRFTLYQRISDSGYLMSEAYEKEAL
jgi:hypothetical protein